MDFREVNYHHRKNLSVERSCVEVAAEILNNPKRSLLIDCSQRGHTKRMQFKYCILVMYLVLLMSNAGKVQMRGVIIVRELMLASFSVCREADSVQQQQRACSN